MAGHLDPDVLAGFREGLLGRRRSARIRSHLATCPTCASLDQDLAQITELLASAPAPRMPDHLIARLENALAAEAATRTANQELAGHDAVPADAGRGDAGSPDRRPRHTRRTWQPRPAALGVAAAVAAILAIGGYGLASLRTGASSGISSTAGGNVGGPTGNLGPLTTSPPENGPAHSAAGLPAPTGQLQFIESRIDYTPGHLASQARAVLAGHPFDALSQRQGLSTGSASTSEPQSCIEVVTHGLSPLLVDEAYYQGQPATVIVLPPAHGRAGQVWVVRPTCSATNPDVVAHTQFTTG